MVFAAYEKLWVAIYVCTYLCWLPLDYVPVVSEAGKGTLLAYLGNHSATFIAMVLSFAAQVLFPRVRVQPRCARASRTDCRCVGVRVAQDWRWLCVGM